MTDYNDGKWHDTAPREWWIVGDCEAYASEAEALEACKALYGNPAPVHVREVKE